MKLSMVLLCGWGVLAVACVSGGTNEPTGLSSNESAELNASSASTRFYGAWVPTEGNGDRLVFERTADGTGHHYFSDQTVYCVRAPCPPVRHEGSFSAVATVLYLTHDGATERHRYRFNADGTLSLYTVDGVLQHYRSVGSYCRFSDDCVEQGLRVPACVGHFSCDTATSACSYACGLTPCATVRCTASTVCSVQDGHAVCAPR